MNLNFDAVRLDQSKLFLKMKIVLRRTFWLILPQCANVANSSIYKSQSRSSSTVYVQQTFWQFYTAPQRLSSTLKRTGTEQQNDYDRRIIRQPLVTTMIVRLLRPSVNNGSVLLGTTPLMMTAPFIAFSLWWHCCGVLFKPLEMLPSNPKILFALALLATRYGLTFNLSWTVEQ